MGNSETDVTPTSPSNEDDRVRALEDHGLFRWLNLSVETVEQGHVEFRLPYDEKFANFSAGTVHGGVTATVIDTASGFALQTTFDDPTTARLTTTDLNVRYVRPASTDLHVEADVVRAGDSMGVTESTVTTADTDNNVVATGGTSYRIYRE